MSFSSGLTPQEHRKAYESTIQLGKDVKTQRVELERFHNEMIDAQLSAASDIIVSQDRLSEGIDSLSDSLSYGLERVEEGIYGLKSAFEWGMSEVVWQIEQNRKELKSILVTLEAPLDTQAKERRKRAVEAYGHGWIDEAEEEFIESEKLNKFDFTIHISLGMIYLFHKKDISKSLSYFEKAIKYATPKSQYHASYALLYKALIKYDAGLVDDAAKCTMESIRLSPDFAEALYQHAQYNALLNNRGESISSLERAIRIDRNYCLKVNSDDKFENIRNEVNNLLTKLRDEAYSKITKEFNAVFSEIFNVFQIIDDIKKINTFDDNRTTMLELIEQIKTLMERKSYFDLLDAINLNNGLIEKNKKYLEDTNSKIQQTLSSTRSEVSSLEYKLKAEESAQRNRLQDNANGNRKVFRIIGITFVIFLGISMKSFLVVVVGIAVIYFLTAVNFTGAYVPSAKYNELCKQKDIIVKNIDYISSKLNLLNKNKNTTESEVKSIAYEPPYKSDYKYSKYCPRCNRKYCDDDKDYCNDCQIELEAI